MTDIAVPPYWAMVVQELLKPFFIFQVFSLGVWTLQEYYVYMYSILIMTAYSALANAYGEWRNLRALQTLARSEAVVDRVSLDPRAGFGRAGGLVTEAVPSSALHPGDLVRVIPNMVLPCDVVLVTGHAILSEGTSSPANKPSEQGVACLVCAWSQAWLARVRHTTTILTPPFPPSANPTTPTTTAMLTGEAAPVMKVRACVASVHRALAGWSAFPFALPSLPRTLYVIRPIITFKPTPTPPQAAVPPGDSTAFQPASERDKKFLLFSGTKVLQARCGPLPRVPEAQAPPLQEARYLWEAVVEEEPGHAGNAGAEGRPALGRSHSHSMSRSRTQSRRASGSVLHHQQHYQRPIAVGMVMRTGFSTARGQLVRAILFPPPPKFDFEAQVPYHTIP